MDYECLSQKKISVAEVFLKEELNQGANDICHVQALTELVLAFVSRACMGCLALKRVGILFWN